MTKEEKKNEVVRLCYEIKDLRAEVQATGAKLVEERSNEIWPIEEEDHLYYTLKSLRKAYSELAKLDPKNDYLTQ